MRDLYGDFNEGRDDCNRIKFAGAGYNGAPATLRREIDLCAADRNCDVHLWSENVATKRSRAIPYWQENRSYVSRITQREGIYAADGWGAASCKGR
jgi:hypothetical protein